MARAILVIDDEEAVRLSLAMLLRMKGYTATAVADGEAGLRALDEGAFALVLTDLMMPEGTGIELIARMRARSPGLAIIAMSGGGRIGGREALALARESGADACLEKPFEPKELVALLESCLHARPD